MTVLLAFTSEHAARVTNVSERRIRYWDATGVLSPTLAREPRHKSPYGRIYSFQDLVGLRTLGELRDSYDFPLQKLRATGEWLRETYDQPWSSLRFYIWGRGRTSEVMFREPGSEILISVKRRGQAVLSIELEPIAIQTEKEANKLTERTPDQIGEVVRNRYVLSNAPVLAGTRIPTKAVWNFHRVGDDTSAIIREYPRLTPVDILRAIEFEENRIQQKAS